MGTDIFDLGSAHHWKLFWNWSGITVDAVAVSEWKARTDPPTGRPRQSWRLTTIGRYAMRATRP